MLRPVCVTPLQPPQLSPSPLLMVTTLFFWNLVARLLLDLCLHSMNEPSGIPGSVRKILQKLTLQDVQQVEGCSRFCGKSRLLCSQVLAVPCESRQPADSRARGLRAASFTLPISSAQPPCQWLSSAIQGAWLPTWNTMRRRVVVRGVCASGVIGSCFSQALHVGLPVYVLVT